MKRMRVEDEINDDFNFEFYDMLQSEDEQASNIGIFPQLTLDALFQDALLGGCSATRLTFEHKYAYKRGTRLV